MRRIAFFAAAGLTLAACQTDGQVPIGGVGFGAALPLAVTLPPPQYDHEPAARYEIREVHWAAVHRLCEGSDPMPGQQRVPACALDFGPLGWTIIMPTRDGSLLADDWGRLLRHEKGHVNGWGRSHPGARLIGGYTIGGDRP